MRSPNKWFLIPVLCLGLFLVAIVGCESDSSDSTSGVNEGLVRCQDCDEVQDWVYDVAIAAMERILEQNLEETLNGRNYYDDDDDQPVDGDDDMGDDDDDMGDDDDSEPNDDDDESNDGDGGNDHSDTNTQEKDVDEADIVKTDGDTLYLSTGGYFLIFDARPADQTQELSRVDIEGYVLEMFIYEDVALVFSTLENWQLPETVWPDFDHEMLSQTILKMTLIDISDLKNPNVIRELYAEGTYQSSRRVEASARVIVHGQAFIPGVEYYIYPDDYGCYDEDNNWEIDEDCLREAYEKLRKKNREIIENTPLEQWLPQYYDIRQTDEGTVTESGILSECVDFFHPLEMLGNGVLSVISIMLDDPLKKNSDISIIADGQIVYASKKSLYITGDQDTQSWWTDWDEEAPNEVSEVHKFDIGTTPEYAIYRGSGEIDGWVLNQFSMSEFDDVLRIATTVGRWSGDGGYSNIFCLEENDGKLDIIGRITDIAPDELIYAARFVGDKGFLVTFEQVDPLFTIDLSDPKNPKLVGELKVPGFSTYLHPMDDDHLLAIGVQGDEWGWTFGVQLTIFDVSDFANPKVMHQADVGDSDSYSEAQYNHKAFLYYKKLDMLAIPLTEYYWGDDDDDDVWEGDDDDAGDDDDFMDQGSDEFSGFYIYQVTLDGGFDAEGTVEHTNFEGEPESDDHYGLPAPLRSVVIETDLYTISDLGLVVTDLYNFQDLVRIDLPYEEYYPYGDDDDWVDDDDDRPDTDGGDDAGDDDDDDWK